MCSMTYYFLLHKTQLFEHGLQSLQVPASADLFNSIIPYFPVTMIFIFLKYVSFYLPRTITL